MSQKNLKQTFEHTNDQPVEKFYTLEESLQFLPQFENADNIFSYLVHRRFIYDTGQVRPKYESQNLFHCVYEPQTTTWVDYKIMLSTKAIEKLKNFDPSKCTVFKLKK